MNYARLKADALFVIRVGHAWALPKGTTVSLLPDAPSPVTGQKSELHVLAPDAGGRPWRGWLDRSTPLEKISEKDGASSRSVWKSVTHLNIPPIDELRESVVLTVPRGGYNKRELPVDPWTMFDWLCVHGTAKRAKLEAVLQQFKKSIPKDAVDVIAKVVKLILPNEEVTMARITKTRARLNRDSRRQAAQAKASTAVVVERKQRSESDRRKGERRANRMPQTVAEALLALKIPALRPGANKLAKGTASRKDLLALRETINAAADKARERGKKSLASQLSAQNRLVRRLERAARRS